MFIEFHMSTLDYLDAQRRKNSYEEKRKADAEGKAVGYDTKMMRQLIKLRKMKPDDRAEMEMLLETYKAALGMG